MRCWVECLLGRKASPPIRSSSSTGGEHTHTQNNLLTFSYTSICSVSMREIGWIDVEKKLQRVWLEKRRKKKLMLRRLFFREQLAMFASRLISYYRFVISYQRWCELSVFFSPSRKQRRQRHLARGRSSHATSRTQNTKDAKSDNNSWYEREAKDDLSVFLGGFSLSSEDD